MSLLGQSSGETEGKVLQTAVLTARLVFSKVCFPGGHYASDLVRSWQTSIIMGGCWPHKFSHIPVRNADTLNPISATPAVQQSRLP